MFRFIVKRYDSMKAVAKANTNGKANKTSFTPNKRIRIVRTKDNTTINVIGYSQAYKVTDVKPKRIKYNINNNKEINGYKFFDW